MFSKAYEVACNFTLPVITSMRFFDKTIGCSIGSFVIMNNEGWIVTAAHVIQSYSQFQTDKSEIDIFHNAMSAINKNPDLSEKVRKRERNKYSANSKWITNFSFWWGNDGVRIEEFKVNMFYDLAIGKLTPFHPDSVKTYPIIKKPEYMKIGTSLCKLGYPFHSVNASFDEETGNFSLAPGALPVPRFPIEGIYTRNSIIIDPNNKKQTKFIETSSPGLRGQSGGPIFDIEGILWGIQSRTTHLELGFNPQVKKNNKITEENQFLNVGLGVHPEILISFLEENKVAYNLSDN